METEHLVIRPFVPGDFDDYYAYIMDPELQRGLGLHDVCDRASALLCFQWLTDNREFLALIPKETGCAVGHIAVHPAADTAAALRPGLRGCSLSFAIAANQRRKGLMEEALRAVIPELFHSGADYIDCEYTADNLASRRLQEKLGFLAAACEDFGDVKLTVCILDRNNPCVQGGYKYVC